MGAKFFQKPWNNFKNPSLQKGLREASSVLRTPVMLGTFAQNVVTVATWNQGILHMVFVHNFITAFLTSTSIHYKFVLNDTPHFVCLCVDCFVFPICCNIS